MTSSFLYKENLKDAEMVIEQMRSAGLNAMLCTESVPVSLQGVRCGSPTEIFDQEIDDYIMLPKSLVGLNPEMMIPVLGDSMIDAGYEEDDLLRVRFGAAYRDLDNVLVNIDGTFTVKTLFTDEQGQVWLVPRNNNYRAIPLSEDQEVSIIGVVIGVFKDTHRASSREVMQMVRLTKNEMKEIAKLSRWPFLNVKM